MKAVLKYKTRGTTVINWSKWCTQREKAEQLGLSLPALMDRIKRHDTHPSANTIESWYIPELGITLVRR